MALDPGDAIAQCRLGLQYLENGEPRRAIKPLKVALDHDPDDRATLYNLSLALRRDGQEDEAERIHDRVSKLTQSRNKVAETGRAIGALTDAGLALEKSGDAKGALEKYRAALDLDPTDAVLRLNFGLTLCRLGRWQQAAAELREVLRVDPNNADAAKALYIALDHVKKAAPQTGKAGSPEPVQKE